MKRLSGADEDLACHSPLATRHCIWAVFVAPATIATTRNWQSFS